MFTDRDLAVMIEVAQELRSAIRANRKAGRDPSCGIDPQAVDDLCGFVLAQNEAFPEDEEDEPDSYYQSADAKFGLPHKS